MGAKANQKKVELMVSYADFFRRVGAVKNFYPLCRKTPSFTAEI